MIDPTGGRAELERLLSGANKRIVAQSRKVAATTAERINAGDSAADAVAFAMTKHKVAERSRDEVGRAVVQSLCVGNGIWPKVTADMMPTLQKTALAGIWDDSDLTLSQRLHGTDAAMRSDVVAAINAHVQARNDTWTASRRIYDGYGFGGALKTAKLDQLPADLRRLEQSARKVLTPDAMAQLQLDAKRLSAYADRLATAPLKAAYKQMAAKLDAGLTKGLERLVQTAMDEKARYHASRILRTESARAWGQGFQAQCDDDPDVVGWRWETSGAHKIFDICDFHARADLFGMGPGIYPKDRHPSYPAHPHCLCQASMVFKGETPDPRPNVQGGGKAALDGMTGAQRARLLTVKGSQGYNGQWQDNLRHWTGAGPAKLSAGARAVLMGVQKWQPPLEFAQGQQVSPITATLQAPKQARSSAIAKPLSSKAASTKIVGPVNDIALAVEVEERAIWKRKIENAAIIKQGEEVERVKGIKSSVSFTQAQVQKMQGAIVTHNHPSGWDHAEGVDLHAGNSFSLADLKLASVGKVDEMRAITPVWEYSVKPEGVFPDKAKIASIHAQAYSEVWMAFIDETKAGSDPLASDFYHRVSEKVANQLGWSYSRRKHGYKK